jgi:hypothetical protein
MKKLFIALCGGALVVAGTVVYRTRAMTVLSENIAEQIQQIETAYGAMAKENITAIESVFNAQEPDEEGQLLQMTSEQHGLVRKIRAEYAQLLKEGKEDLQRLNTINRLQLSLHAFVATFSSEHPLGEDANIVELRKMIGEKGTVRKILQAYNANAKLWNNNIQSQVGSITASVGDLGDSLYPYLRFDGRADANQVINLGK